MAIAKDYLLKSAYREIIQGYSPAVFDGKDVFIKHFCSYDQTNVEEIYSRYYDLAIKRGVPSEEDKLKFLDKHGLWTTKNQKEVIELTSYIDGMKNTKKVLARISEINSLQKRIEEEEKKLNTKLKEKASLMGLTADSFAGQKMNDAYLYCSFFSDKNLTIPIFDIKQFDDLDPEDLSKLETEYLNRMEKCSTLNIKKIALSTFFQNIFYLAENQAYFFYGKPIAVLTYYQTELFSYGRYFKSIIENEKPPEDLLNDPDRLVDWLQGVKNMKKQIGEAQSKEGFTAIMGMQKEDLDALGESEDKSSDISLHKVLKNKTLQGEELMKLLG